MSIKSATKEEDPTTRTESAVELRFSVDSVAKRSVASTHSASIKDCDIMQEHPSCAADYLSIGHNEDRRRAIRFPLEMDLCYRNVVRRDSWNKGQSINISSSGLLMRTDDPLPQGMEIEVAIQWPKKLDDRVPLQLIVKGRVARVLQSGAAIEIQRFEFRTIAVVPAERRNGVARI